MGFLKSIFGGLFGSDDTAEKSARGSEKLRRKIEYDGAYIQNLRLGRSWVLPQLVDQAFGSRGEFRKGKYLESVKSLDSGRVWRLMLRNYRVLSSHPDAERARWWTKEVAVRMVEWDYAGLEKSIESATEYLLRNCSGGAYIALAKTGATRDEKLFFINDPDPKSRWNKSNSVTVEMLKARMQGLVGRVRAASSAKELYAALAEYDRSRFDCTVKWPEEFIDAYVGDGAYCSMMTMVKYLGLCFRNDARITLTRDECIDAIRRKSDECTGLELLDFCAKKFFSGPDAVFDACKYRNGGYRTE